MKKAAVPGFISNLILFAVIILCIPVTVPRFLGYQSYNIVSGSMEPEIPVGSLVYVKSAMPEEVAVGDVIAYSSGASESVITHRVTGNNADLREFTTKGDANDREDLAPVGYERLIGKVEIHIAGLGRVCALFASASGKMSLLALVVLAVALRLLTVVLQKMFQKEEQSLRPKSKVTTLLVPAGILMIAAGGYVLASTQINYQNSNELYEDLNEEFAGTQTGSETSGGEIDVKADWEVGLDVDFDKLKAVNPEVVGWIYFENEDISYPLMYSGEDDKYLHTAMDGSSAVAGSIFIEGKNKPDFSDSHTIIYGHNMRNLSMFGKLRYYYREEDYYKDHQYFQIITEERAYRYRIFAYENVSADSFIYSVPFAADDSFGEFIEKLYGLSLRDTGVKADKNDHIITCSTCSTTGNRFVVHGVRVGEQ